MALRAWDDTNKRWIPVLVDTDGILRTKPEGVYLVDDPTLDNAEQHRLRLTVDGKLMTYDPVIDGKVDDIEGKLDDGTHGLAALETLIDEVETMLKHASYGLAALNTDIDKLLTGIIQGTGTVLPANKSIFDILGIELTGAVDRSVFDTPILMPTLLVPPAVHPTMGAGSLAVWCGFVNHAGPYPTDGQITPGTININRQRGAAAPVAIVSGAALSKLQGSVYYPYTWPGASWAAGDKYMVSLQGMGVTMGGKTITFPTLGGFGQVV